MTSPPHSRSPSLWTILTCGLFVLVLVISVVQGDSNSSNNRQGRRNKFHTNNTQCTARLEKEADLAVAKLLGFGPRSIGRNFPENEQQLGGYCQETTQLTSRLDFYLKTCFVKAIRDVGSVLVYSLKSNVRQFCRKKRTKKLNKLMNAASCINRNLIQNDECIMSFYNTTKQLVNVKPSKLSDPDKIKYACCNYVSSIRCVEGYIDRYDCIRNDRELLLDFIRGVFGSFVDFMCGEYNEQTTRCDEIRPPPKPRPVNRKHYASFLFVLLDLMESMQNFEAPA